MGSKEIAIVGCIFSTMLLLVSCVPNTMKPSNEAKMGNKVVNDSKCLGESHFYVGGSVAYGSGGGGGYGSGGGGGFGTGGGGSGFGSGGGGGGFGSGGGGGEGGGEGSGFGGGSGGGGEGGGYGGGNGGGEGGGEGGGFGGGGGGLDTVNPSKDTSLHGGGNRKYGGHNTFAVPQAKP